MEPYSRYRRDDEGIVKWFLKLKFQLTKDEAQGTIQAIVSWQLRTECMFIAFRILSGYIGAYNLGCVCVH